MNLLEILRERVDDLPDGDYMQGLKSVLQHIEVAGKHLERGQNSADDTAFTDAIYRTNQAFEGSLKEAYRVLTSKNPDGETPYNIETYLQNENVLRPRVLSQLKNYRQDWRNPSTHDYRLDFDEDEALLAIVTVSAFAIVLIDQITERIAFEQAKKVAIEQPAPQTETQSVIDKVSNLIEQFVAQFNQTHLNNKDVREIELIGALAGFLSANAPELKIESEKLLSPETRFRADMLISNEEENLILELKRNNRTSSSAILQVSSYMELSKINQAILFLYGNSSNKVIKSEQSALIGTGRIAILSVE